MKTESLRRTSGFRFPFGSTLVPLILVIDGTVTVAKSPVEKLAILDFALGDDRASVLAACHLYPLDIFWVDDLAEARRAL